MATGRTPVLVGVGQVTNHWMPNDGLATAPSPTSLCVQASERALADAGITAAQIEMLAVARTIADSTPRPRHPFGVNSNPPGTIARALSATPRHATYEIAGGQSSQKLANEMASRIYDGEFDCALITGAEAIKAAKSAAAQGMTLDWADSSDMPFEDRGPGAMLLSRTEIKHGLVVPAFFYAIFENILAREWGETRSQHRRSMSELFAKFAAIADKNPDSQFETKFDVDFLATPSRQNYPFADPFLKWHMAQDAVSQSAAIVMMSENKADALGIAREKRVYLHGMGEATDDNISERPHLDRSWAMQTALDRALSQADCRQQDIDVFDLYSCFPCAVFSAMAALGLRHETENRALTVTGGLPFFGGPGNNYSLHAIVSMAARLRASPGQTGLVLANGGWMTKEAVGIWSTNKPESFQPVAAFATPPEHVEIDPDPREGILESFTVTHGREGPEKGIIFARSRDGRRFLGNVTGDALAPLMQEASPIGRRVSAQQTDEVNTISFVD